MPNERPAPRWARVGSNLKEVERYASDQAAPDQRQVISGQRIRQEQGASRLLGGS